jgi:hypothetical protein
VELPGGYGDGVMASFIFTFGFLSAIISDIRTSDDIRVTLDWRILSMCHAEIALGCSRSDLPHGLFSCKSPQTRLPQIYSLGVRQHSAKSGSRTDDVDEPRFTS